MGRKITDKIHFEFEWLRSQLKVFLVMSAAVLFSCLARTRSLRYLKKKTPRFRVSAVVKSPGVPSYCVLLSPSLGNCSTFIYVVVVIS